MTKKLPADWLLFPMSRLESKEIKAECNNLSKESLLEVVEHLSGQPCYLGKVTQEKVSIVSKDDELDTSAYMNVLTVFTKCGCVYQHIGNKLHVVWEPSYLLPLNGAKSTDEEKAEANNTSRLRMKELKPLKLINQ